MCIPVILCEASCPWQHCATLPLLTFWPPLTLYTRLKPGIPFGDLHGMEDQSHDAGEIGMAPSAKITLSHREVHANQN